MTIPYSRQSISNEDLREVEAALESSFLTTGPRVAQFEQALLEVTGGQFAVACSNGTTALHLAVLGLGICKDDLVLVPAISFLASANCVEFVGGRVDFLDISSDRLVIDAEEIKRYCEEVEVPKAIVAVDYAGYPAVNAEIWALAKQFGFKVIQDAAHSLGTSYSSPADKELGRCGDGCFADIATFSFHPVKNITTGEGGAVVTNDSQIADTVRLLRAHGMERPRAESAGAWYYEMETLGFNYRITDIQCALGLSQLRRLEEFKTARRRLFERYNEAFAASDGLIIPPILPDQNPCFHLYPLRIAAGEDKRRHVFDALRGADIFVQVHYIPIYWQPYYRKRYNYQPGKCPNAELFYRQEISLPIYHGLNNAQQDRVIELVLKAIEE